VIIKFIDNQVHIWFNIYIDSLYLRRYFVKLFWSKGNF